MEKIFLILFITTLCLLSCEKDKKIFTDFVYVDLTITNIEQTPKTIQFMEGTFIYKGEELKTSTKKEINNSSKFYKIEKNSKIYKGIIVDWFMRKDSSLYYVPRCIILD